MHQMPLMAALCSQRLESPCCLLWRQGDILGGASVRAGMSVESQPSARGLRAWSAATPEELIEVRDRRCATSVTTLFLSILLVVNAEDKQYNLLKGLRSLSQIIVTVRGAYMLVLLCGCCLRPPAMVCLFFRRMSL